MKREEWYIIGVSGGDFVRGFDYRISSGDEPHINMMWLIFDFSHTFILNFNFRTCSLLRTGIRESEERKR